MNASLAREIIIAEVVLVFALVVQFILIPSQIEQTVEYEMASLSPSFFPELAIMFIGGLATLWLLSHLWHLVKGVPTEPMKEYISDSIGGEFYA